MVKSILVGLDGSPLAESILPYVSTLARALEAQVDLVQVVAAPEELREMQGYEALYKEIEEKAHASAQTYLTGIERRLGETGVRAQGGVAAGDAATEILNYARREQNDLIALATHGRSGVQRWIYGSVAEKVLQNSTVPVLLLRPDEQLSGQPAIRHLIVPLDGSPLAESVLPLVETLAVGLRVPVTLLRVVELPVYALGDPAIGMMTDIQQLIDGLAETAQACLDPIAARLGAVGIKVTTAKPVGMAALEITGAAEAEDGNLVVMATHGRTGLVGALLGSVARQTLRSGVPTLIVRPAATGNNPGQTATLGQAKPGVPAKVTAG